MRTVVDAGSQAFSSKAVWFEAPRRVSIKTDSQEKLFRTLGERDVLVRTIYSGISAGTEMLVYRGQVPKDLNIGLGALGDGDDSGDGDNTFAYPVKYGYSNVGRVIRAGEKCETTSSGELVFTFHPHETRFVVGEDQCIPLGKIEEPMTGVFVANLETAIGIVHDSTLRLGERVVVIGLGIVGILVSLLAKRSGVSLFAIEKLQKRREIAQKLGIECGSTVPSIHDPDVVIEVSGNPMALQEAINISGLETRIVVGSWYGTKTAALNLGERFHRNRNKIISSQVSNIEPSLQGRWSKRRRLDVATGYLSSLPLRCLITDVYPFEQAADAFKKIEEFPQDTLQVVLKYGDE